MLRCDRDERDTVIESALELVLIEDIARRDLPAGPKFTGRLNIDPFAFKGSVGIGDPTAGDARAYLYGVRIVRIR